MTTNFYAILGPSSTNNVAEEYSNLAQQKNKSKTNKDGSKKEFVESLNFHPCYYEIPLQLTANEVLMSEDYTRVTIKGPNSNVTHYFCNFVLKCFHDEFDYNIMISDEGKKERTRLTIRDELSCHLFGSESSIFSSSSSSSSSENFECFCYACKKKMKVGDVMYVYKKTSTFCSFECVSVDVLVEEIMEVMNKFSSPISTSLDDNNEFIFFMEGIPI